MSPYHASASIAQDTMAARPSHVMLQTRKNANSEANMGSTRMPQDITPEAHQKAVENAYKMALSGRRSASLAVARLESLIYRRPYIEAKLRAAAMNWLSGTDLTASAGAAPQAAAQIIIQRLNEALDGNGRGITRALLDDDAVRNLRIFRMKVRELLSPRTTGDHIHG